MANPTEEEMMADLAAADTAGDTQLAQHIAGQIKAARAPAPVESPGLLKRGAQLVGSMVLPAHGSLLDPILPNALNEYRAPPLPKPPPLSPQRPGESDYDYGLRTFNEEMNWSRSPEGMRGLEAIVGYTTPRGTLGAPVPTPSPGGGLTGALKRLAERAALRSTNADRTAYRKAFKNSPEAAQEAGRFLLNEDVPLRSPQAMREGLQEIMTQEGPQVGALTQKADQAGVTFDLRKAATAAMKARDVADLAKNTEHRAIYDRVQAFLQDQIAQHGDKVPPSTAHDIRMQLDRLANWDQTKTKEAVDAWRAVRGEVSDELGGTMVRAGLGTAWDATNKRFGQAAKLEPMAKIGSERREGNRWGSPSEKGAAIAGGVAAAMHNPIAGLALPAATFAANRYGMPVTARAADALAGVLGRVGPINPTAAPRLTPGAVLLQRLGLGPAPAAAEEER